MYVVLANQLPRVVYPPAATLIRSEFLGTSNVHDKSLFLHVWTTEQSLLWSKQQAPTEIKSFPHKFFSSTRNTNSKSESVCTDSFLQILNFPFEKITAFQRPIHFWQQCAIILLIAWRLFPWLTPTHAFLFWATITLFHRVSWEALSFFSRKHYDKYR